MLRIDGKPIGDLNLDQIGAALEQIGIELYGRGEAFVLPSLKEIGANVDGIGGDVRKLGGAW